uniref:Uncharacterized protein n=1 Tax=Chlamydomonas leiostraca TaxID=1034604 RepID=A0A7S0RZN0_9CHLO
MLAARTTPRAFSAGKARTCAPQLPARAARSVAVKALDDTNFAVNLLSSAAAGSVAAAVTIATAENREKVIEKVQNLDTWTIAPIGGAILADTLAHSIPGLNVLFSLASEPLGAACGVAYMMTLVLSSKAVDPKTLAPEGTVLNAQKAEDSRASLRVPFTKLIPTALKVVDPENKGESGEGWTIGPDGLPKLPINSVLIVTGVGVLILEAASHAPVFSLFMPRVLQVAAWLAVVGYGIEVAGLEKKSA